MVGPVVRGLDPRIQESSRVEEDELRVNPVNDGEGLMSDLI